MALWLTAAHFLAAVDKDLSARPAQEALYMLAAVGGVLRLVADVAAAEEPDEAARLLPAAATFVDWSWEGVAPSFFVVLSYEVALSWGRGKGRELPALAPAWSVAATAGTVRRTWCALRLWWC